MLGRKSLVTFTLLTILIAAHLPVHAEKYSANQRIIFKRGLMLGSSGMGLCGGVLMMTIGTMMQLSHPEIAEQKLKEAKAKLDVAEVEAKAREISEMQTADEIGSQVFQLGVYSLGLGFMGFYWGVDGFRKMKSPEADQTPSEP